MTLSRGSGVVGLCRSFYKLLSFDIIILFMLINKHDKTARDDEVEIMHSTDHINLMRG